MNPNRGALFADPVSKVDYVPKKKELHVGETLNCTADGNPAPRFTWHPLSSPDGQTIQRSVLPITQKMIGDNKWECRVADYTAITKEITVEFTVGERNMYTVSPVDKLSA